VFGAHPVYFRQFNPAHLRIGIALQRFIKPVLRRVFFAGVKSQAAHLEINIGDNRGVVAIFLDGALHGALVRFQGRLCLPLDVALKGKHSQIVWVVSRHHQTIVGVGSCVEASQKAEAYGKNR